MTGVVRGREARVHIKVCGPARRFLTIEAVIDTGFTGWLTLPPALVSSLGLPWINRVRGLLADGSESFFDVFEATINWHRRRLVIPVEQASVTPMIGM